MLIFQGCMAAWNWVAVNGRPAPDWPFINIEGAAPVHKIPSLWYCRN
jgi:hypothetical protein